MSGSDDLLGDLVAEAQRGARGETGALVLLERETEMRNLSKKAKTIIAGAAIAGLASTGVAYAYWTQSGSGTGAATTGTTTSITVNQTTTPSGMYPGSIPQLLAGNFDNPNPGGVVISSVTAVVSSVTAGFSDPLKPECLAANYAIGGSATGSTVPSGVGVGSWTGLTIQLTNTASNQDNCKNATANITYQANPIP